jgi:5-methylthioribose kinase
MGFDIGAIIGNLLLSYFSQDGHETTKGSRKEYKLWLLDTIVHLWEKFKSKFSALWYKEAKGDAFNNSFLEEEQLTDAMDVYFTRLFQDTLGFGGAKMIR